MKKIQHEMPVIGTKLIHKTRRKGEVSKQIVANVVETGSKNKMGILYNGQIYKTMSAAARAAGGYMVDGWIYWKPSS